MLNINLSEKVALVTGASRGIGHTIKQILDECGATVVTPTRQEVDLSNLEAVELYAAAIKNRQIDIFVHCAGLNKLAGIKEIDATLFQNVLNVNLIAPTILLNAIIPSMEANKWGRVVFISSLYSMVSRERRIAYSASKNALTGLCKSMAIEEGVNNILVNCVAPGYVLTEMTKQNLSPDEIKVIESSIPTGRFQTPEDIANLVAYLSSDLNTSITGQLIAVDGGFLCH